MKKINIYFALNLLLIINNIFGFESNSLLSYKSFSIDKMSDDCFISSGKNCLNEEKSSLMNKLKIQNSTETHSIEYFLNMNELYLSGDREGNGGNLISLSFKKRAFSIIKKIPSDKVQLKDQLLRLIEEVKIYTVDRIVFMGLDLTALNFHKNSKVIVLASSFLHAGGHSDLIKDILILHELLPFLGYNDDDYSESIKLLSNSLCYLNDTSLHKLEKALNKKCQDVVSTEVTEINFLELSATELQSIFTNDKLPNLSLIKALVLNMEGTSDLKWFESYLVSKEIFIRNLVIKNLPMELVKKSKNKLGSLSNIRKLFVENGRFAGNSPKKVYMKFSKMLIGNNYQIFDMPTELSLSQQLTLVSTLYDNCELFTKPRIKNDELDLLDIFLGLTNVKLEVYQKKLSGQIKVNLEKEKKYKSCQNIGRLISKNLPYLLLMKM